MSEMLLDRAGRRRSPATMPGFHAGRPPRNKGLRYPADPPKVEEIIAVMRTAGDGAHGRRLRGLIVTLWRAGLRIQEALALAGSRSRSPARCAARASRQGRTSPRGRHGQWGWDELQPWRYPVYCPLCERTADVVRQTAGIVASPSDLTYDVWTDGACAGNPGGPGGYAAVLVGRRADGSIVKQWEVSGGEAETTNNRMELMAVVAGLRELIAPARVCIHIDSSYVMNTFTQGRRERWQGNDWRTSARKPVKNRKLWEQLFTEVDRHQVEWEKVPGHTGVELNERADELACAQRDAHDRR